MPIINTCYISEAEIKRDEDFFDSIGLSPEQKKSIAIYFYERLTGTTLKTCLYTILAVALGAVLTLL